MSNTVIITRKYNLIPEKCDQKIWKKKVREFLENEIIRMNELISQRSNKQAWKEKLKAKAEQYEAYLKKYDETRVPRESLYGLYIQSDPYSDGRRSQAEELHHDVDLFRDDREWRSVHGQPT